MPALVTSISIVRKRKEQTLGPFAETILLSLGVYQAYPTDSSQRHLVQVVISRDENLHTTFISSR